MGLCEVNMFDRYILIVGIEKYLEEEFSKVDYAGNDADGFSAVMDHLWEGNGIIEILKNEEATNAQIGKHLERIMKCGTEKDEFWFFFAGHGLRENGYNFLACYDSSINAIQRTCLSLQNIFVDLRNSNFKKVRIFIDACHSGVYLEDGMRGSVSELSDKDYVDFCKESESYMVFSACGDDEKSYPVNKLRHGLWTYYLLEAFSGKSSDVFERNNFITTNSLQNYLTTKVRSGCREHFKGKRQQNPKAWGNFSGTDILADLSKIVEQNAQANYFSFKLKEISLLGLETSSVKSLSGFIKGRHTVPKDFSSYSSGFVQNIGEKEIDDQTNCLFEKIKNIYPYKRKDLIIDGNKIITPNFQIVVSLDQSSDSPSDYDLQIEVSGFQGDFFNDNFVKVFTGLIDTMKVECEKPFKIETIIDQLEELDLEPKYDKDFTYCEMEFPELNGIIRFQENIMLYIYPNKDDVKHLLQESHDIPLLLGKHNVKALSNE